MRNKVSRGTNCKTCEHSTAATSSRICYLFLLFRLEDNNGFVSVGD